MFILYGELAYEVTRDSATKQLAAVLSNALHALGKYNTNLCVSISNEIIENTKFPEVLDKPSIFVYEETSNSFTRYNFTDKPVKVNKTFSIKDFSPKCAITGLEKEVTEVFQKYSLHYLIDSSENGVQYPVLHFYNDKCLVGKMDENPVQVLTKALNVVGIEKATEIANTVLTNMFASTAVFIGFVTDNETVCYALRSDGSIRKTAHFSVKSIYTAIMAELPNLKCTSEKAKTAAIYAYNKILYGIGLTDYELASPTGFTDKGEPIFERTIDGIDFEITPSQRNWRSKEVLHVEMALISWGPSEHIDNPDSCVSRFTFKKPTHLGFSIVPLTCEEATKYSQETGITCTILREDYNGVFRTHFLSTYYGHVINHIESIPVFSETDISDSMGIYFKTHKDMTKVTDKLHFKLETAANII